MMRIAFLGDTALIGRFDITKNSEEKILESFSEITEILQECDYVVANLETPLTNCEVSKEFKTLTLKSSPLNIQILKKIGVNVVTIANNHIYDYGTKGLEETVKVLKDYNVTYCGIDNEGVILKGDVADVYLDAFCCFSTNAWHYKGLMRKGKLNTLIPENCLRCIKMGEINNAYPIICVHWGEENTHYPKYEHFKFAKEFLNQYEATIIGHHPHVIQGICDFQKGSVAFSLGNFCFDDCSSKKYGVSVKQTEANRKGYIYIIEIDEKRNCKRKVVFYEEKNGRLTICKNSVDAVNEYSNRLKKIENPLDYEKLRQKEIDKAKHERLGKRDLNWFIKHFNLVSIVAVIQRKINRKMYLKYWVR